jgi:octaprenyl-diphosphate synthase
MQLMNCNDPNTTEASYLEVIYSKTARLFEAATQLAAVLTEQTEQVEIAMQSYGRHLGTAFQLIDDILDYDADTAIMGKNTGDDLAEGKPTLPLLYAMWNANDADATLIRTAIEQGDGIKDFNAILAIIKSTGALIYTRDLAEQEADAAIAALSIIPESDYKQALIELAHIAVERDA